jgi:sugar phosphate isomerase/epimerase
MKMKLACQEGLVPGATFAEKLRNMERYGFDGVELAGAAMLDDAGWAERKAALADSPIRPSSSCGGHPLRLVHPDPAERRVTLDSLKRLMERAAEVEPGWGPILVPIFNRDPRVPDLSPYMSSHQLEIELLVCLLRELAAHGEQCGSVALLEPLNRYESNSLRNQAEGADVVRRVNSPAVRLMSDFFHMSIEERSIPDTLRNVGDVCGHCHLADNTRLEPGTGMTNFAAGFAALKEVGFGRYMAFECGLSGPAEEALPRSVAYLRECIG